MAVATQSVYPDLRYQRARDAVAWRIGTAARRLAQPPLYLPISDPISPRYGHSRCSTVAMLTGSRALIYL
jgi:hypothetical protein